MNPLSPNVRRVRLTAAVLGLELEEKQLDFTRGEHKSPEYLALNPNGAVPTLVDGDLVLTESRAIMQYLASKKPESGLLPRDEKSRAEVTRWQFWDASHFASQLGTLVFERMIKPMFGMGEPDQRKIEDAISGCRRFGAVLDTHLAGKQYIVGSSLTIADLTIACSLMYAKQTEAPVGDFPNIQSWFSRVSDLDAWKNTSPQFATA
ncbi:MAG: glutathione S-transferase family protein [Kofleriaceae bacterium]|nr:glutathione S-transferase family protein [Kofleriaceae bacterium]